MYLYLRDSLKRIELSTAVKVSGDAANPAMAVFLDSTNAVVARLSEDDIAAYGKVDLGPVLQVVATPTSNGAGQQASFEHQQAPQLMDSTEADISE